MKTRKFQLMAVLTALLVTMNLQAQVTIGSLNPPKVGTILDLSSGTTGGLQFSNVQILNLSEIPTNFAGNLGNTANANGGSLKGMVVYNTYTGEDTGHQNVQITEGLYVWTGAAWFKLSDAATLTQLESTINATIGEVGGINSPLTHNTIVESINDLNDIVTALGNTSEVSGSPYLSYADFIYEGAAGAIVHQNPAFAYVTFPDTVGLKIKGGRWVGIDKFDTWRLDYSTTSGLWSPTSNMTAAVNATLGDGSSADLKPIGPATVTDWLQSFRDNIKYALYQLNATQLALNLKQDKLTTTGTNFLLTAPENPGEQPGAKPIADFAPIASPTFTGTVKVPSKTAAATNDGTLVATEKQVYDVASRLKVVAKTVSLYVGTAAGSQSTISYESFKSVPFISITQNSNSSSLKDIIVGVVSKTKTSCTYYVWNNSEASTIYFDVIIAGESE